MSLMKQLIKPRMIGASHQPDECECSPGFCSHILLVSRLMSICEHPLFASMVHCTMFPMATFNSVTESFEADDDAHNTKIGTKPLDPLRWFHVDNFSRLSSSLLLM